MKKAVICICIIGLLAILVMSFWGGTFYAGKTLGGVEGTIYRLKGYFTNFQEVELNISDDGYPYFLKSTGASEEEAEDYKQNSHSYAAYEADVYITNNSDYDMVPVWVVLPGTAMFIEKEGDTVRTLENIPDRRIWVNAWLSEGYTYLFSSEVKPISFKMTVIVRTDGLNSDDVDGLLSQMQLDLQVGSCKKPQWVFLQGERRVIFTPIYYVEN